MAAPLQQKLGFTVSRGRASPRLSADTNSPPLATTDYGGEFVSALKRGEARPRLTLNPDPVTRTGCWPPRTTAASSCPRSSAARRAPG